MKEVKMIYNVGSIVSYSTFGGGHRTVKILNKESDIKNNRPGFDAVEVSQEGKEWLEKSGCYVWGYDSQIKSVIKL